MGREGSCLGITEGGFEAQSWRPRGVSPLNSSLRLDTAPSLLQTWNLGREFAPQNAIPAQQPLLVAKERQGGICILEPLHVYDRLFTGALGVCIFGYHPGAKKDECGGGHGSGLSSRKFGIPRVGQASPMVGGQPRALHRGLLTCSVTRACCP